MSLFSYPANTDNYNYKIRPTGALQVKNVRGFRIYQQLPTRALV